MKSDATCDGGDLDCGSGLLLIIREAMAPLSPGGVLEVKSREISVKEDLPAWCRLVGHTMLGVEPGEGKTSHYFIKKQSADDKLKADMQAARDFEWSVRVRWKEGMKAQAYVRNHTFTVGQPASFDTADPHPSAIEYLLSAVAACLAVGFQWRAGRKGIEVRNLEVSLKSKSNNILVFLGVEDSGHPGLNAIEGSLYVDADGEDDVLEALWQETLIRSPLMQTLVRQVPVNVRMSRA